MRVAFDPRRPGQRIAVVGGGIAGITAAHVLQRAHDVTVFEAEDMLGGHAHAVDVDDGDGRSIRVETAFLVYNAAHYPNFVRFIRDLGVEEATQAADMSASFVDDDKGFHYSLLRGWDGLLYQRRNAVSPRFFRLLAELVQFRRRAHRDLSLGRLSSSLVLGDYLAGYSELFRDNFVVPLAAAIWSLPPLHVLEYPARAIIQFFENHGLLRGRSGDAWRTFRGTSRECVDAFQRRFGGDVRLGEPVIGIRRNPNGVNVRSGRGNEVFDAVVLATHADTSLRLLEDASEAERSTLGAFSYNESVVTLHTDQRQLHPDRRMWSSWNMVRRRGATRVTYHLNRVQRLRAARDWFLTVGAAEIDPACVSATIRYRHPIFSVAAVERQHALADLGSARATFFCGSYAGHGFHEDAVRSALVVARAFELALAPEEGSTLREGSGANCVRHATSRRSSDNVMVQES